MTRGGGALFLVGPTIVVVAWAWRSSGRIKRLANQGLAVAISVALAATVRQLAGRRCTLMDTLADHPRMVAVSQPR
jgi:hypothetical protein